MKMSVRRAMVYLLALVTALTLVVIPAFAGQENVTGRQEVTGEVILEEEAEEEQPEEILLEEGFPEDDELQLKEEGSPALSDSVQPAGARISGTFAKAEGCEIATVRYYTNTDKSDYAFAEFDYDEAAGCYRYEFDAPYEGFEAVEATSLAPNEAATVVAQYYSLSVWDGAVDVSWYNETDTDFYLYYPAQLAGLAAIVNGSVDGDLSDYQVKGTRAKPEDRSVNRGLPEVIKSDYFEDTLLIAGVRGPARKGIMAHDFANRTIHIMQDMDMGGVPGNEIVHSRNTYVNPKTKEGTNAYDYPNWTPVGGDYLMDVSDPDSMIVAFFNGTIEGHGHYINNLYCYRWSWPSVGETAYGYAQGTGLVGAMGSLYNDNRGIEENPEVMPAIRNLGLTGYIFGRRMVGGFVGSIGGGYNAAEGAAVEGGVALENLVNHAYCYATDSKGIGGIAGCAMSEGSIINCYNTGNLNTTYGYPTGGIVGGNEAMDIFCCYNTGTITSSTKNGRGIGSTGDVTGNGYKVDNCYYLDGCGDDLKYPGYYDYNIPDTVTIHVTAMTDAQMRSEELLDGLNVNGTAYVAGDDGYPVLFWEKKTGTGSVTVKNPEGGTVTAVQSGKLPAGTVVYLKNEADTGFKFRNYILNNVPITADYVTVDGDCEVSGYFEAVKAGVLKIEQNPACNIIVTKNGIIMDKEGNPQEVMNYPVAAGDSLYEGDLLIVDASIKEGAVPDDPSLQYSDEAGLAVPYDYEYTYSGKATQSKAVKTFTVDSQINEPETVLTLNVIPRTTQKLWRYIGDVSWYNERETEFVITNALELAGLQKLVNEGVTFEGVTILLGENISLVNQDGTTGTRYWDGIGTTGNPFKGIFDGNGHKITDYRGNMYGFFSCVNGSESVHAQIKNLEIYGTSTKTEASGLVSRAKYTDISNVTSYCKVENGSGYCGGIIGYAQTDVTVTDCLNYGKVEGVSNVGGIAGSLAGGSELSGCINRGDIYCLNAGGNSVGGVAGSTTSIIADCANYGTVTAWGCNIGGVAGQSVSSAASISGSYNAGDLWFSNGTSSQIAVGGILGYGSYYKISNSFNYGQIHAADMPSTNYLGGIIGRDAKRKNGNTTDHVYYLDSSCEYADCGMRFAELPAVTYVTGMREASADAFADPEGVISHINGNGGYLLNNGRYPELFCAVGGHVHSGGRTSCSSYAVCEVCGLEYGDLDPDVHLNLKKENVKNAVWAYDGYTGDTVCADCGVTVQTGNSIPADLDRQALEVIYTLDGHAVKAARYSIGQLDAIKTTGKAGYTYGFDSKGNYQKNRMVATEYILLDDILKLENKTVEDVESISVFYGGNKDTIDKASLTEKIYDFDEQGNRSDAPFAFCITYASMEGDLDTVAAGAQSTDQLRFAYGISQKQYEDKAAVGGRRLVSPVNRVEIALAKAESEVESLELTAQPLYTVYHIGDTFHTDGLELTAYFADGTSRVVTDYELDNVEPLYPEDEFVSLLYGWKALQVPVTVTGHSYDDHTHKCTGLHYDGSVCGLTEQVDLIELESAVGKAEKNRDAVAVSEDGTDVLVSQKWVNSAVYAAFAEAVAAARSVLENPDISQKSVDAAVRQLKLAEQAFDAAKENGSRVGVTAMTLDQMVLSVTEGQKVQLTVTVLPENAADKTVCWSSSDDDVVMVSDTGLVTGLTPGKAVVTAAADDGRVTAECEVTVTGIPVTGIALKPSELEAEREDVLQFTPVISPANASDKKVTWSSSDPAVVKVENDGKAWALKPGVAVVTATTEDGGFTASCTVTVLAPVIAVKSIKLNKTAVELKEKETLQITATVLPTNATSKTLVWTSSNEEVAAVTEDGMVTACKAGAADIRVSSADGSVTSSCKVTVVPSSIKLKSFRLNKTSAEIPTKSTLQLKVTFTPADTTQTGLIWKSSNPSIASVDKNGKVTAKIYGKPVTITVTSAADSSFKATCKIQTRLYDATKDNVDSEMFKAVYWAVDHDISGMTVNFKTRESMTRGQFVHFLWNMAGKPAVNTKKIKNPFADVNSKTAHYKQILWAVDKGLIAGYKKGSKQVFKPEGTLTRQNVATILWKYTGSPKVSNAKKPFSDVAKSAAIAWGKSKGIFKADTSGKFKPKADCIRGDFAVFLYRYNNKYKVVK